jgi:hypothetical protein
MSTCLPRMLAAPLAKTDVPDRDDFLIAGPGQ